MGAYREWVKEDWDVRELLRSAKSIKELFCVYRENRELILADSILRRFVLRVFYHNFCRGFVDLVRAKDEVYYLPKTDPIRWALIEAFLDQIKINYNFSPAF
jgi:hypothetical protein